LLRTREFPARVIRFRIAGHLRFMPTNEAAPPAYRFGSFELDVRTGELRKQGRPVRLRGRPIDILQLLLAERGELISREALRQRLWQSDTFVDFDHGLNSAMNRLREALGDSAENPRFIETLPRRGYRFIAPIEAVERTRPAEPAAHVVGSVDVASAIAPMEIPLPGPEARSNAPGSPFAVSRASRVVLMVAAGAVAAVGVAFLFWKIAAPPHGSKMTLAVLPFENVSSAAEQDFLADGFTEEMIAELGKLDPDRLGVIARTTTRLYKNTRKDIGQIRHELGVDYVLEGSVRRANNRVRITTELVQTSDMTHLWAESYDRDLSDVLTIQSEVAARIAHSLDLALRRPMTPAAPAPSASAYDLYLRGRFLRDQATEEGARKAIEYFTRAISLAPKYAQAYVGLADAYWLLGAPGWEVEQPATLLQKAQSSAERALELDPQLAEAHGVLAMLRLSYRWDRAGAEQQIREALRLNPSSVQAHQYYSTALTTMGRFDEAIAEAHRALELDPLSAPASTTVGIRYLYAGRIPQAMQQFLKTLETSPEFSVAHWGLAQACRASGDTARELAELQRAVELSGNSAYMRAHLAFGLAAAGQRARALAILRDLDAESRERYQSPYHGALIALGLGDREAMYRALERAFSDRSGWMVFLPVEPEFAGERQAPEFQRLLARVKPLP
jgi:TolB-like protein/DNA-binding winged helix-turn-helix (wHTH) protein/Tfp pilus assembly protein PilF